MKTRLLAFGLAVAGWSTGLAADDLQRIAGPDGQTVAVIAPANAALVQTTQLFPEKGGDAVAQLTRILESNGTGLEQLVRVHLYGASPDAISALRQAVREATRGHEPAFTFVQTALPEGAVALDAVARRIGLPPESGQPGKPLAARALLPGNRVYISGQAEKGDGTLADATRKTLEGLERTLQFLGLTKGDTVQVKAFLQPMVQAAAVREQVAAFFAPAPAPPLSLVEWESALPIEIELVAGNGAMTDVGPAVEFLTPPGMTASPVYCRVARVNRGPLIYLGSITARAEDPGAELPDTFAQLRETLEKAGSDYRHLVKATYYVSDAEVNKRHNEIRKEYFDPERPPAASKAAVKSIGLAGRRYVMDLIATSK